MRIIINELKAISKNRPIGYYDDVISKGIIDGKYLHIEMDTYIELCKKYKSENIKDKIKSSACGCCKNKTLPPVKTQIKNAITSMKKVINNIANLNHVFANEDIIIKRNNICNSCEFYLANKKRCSKCGCYTHIKTSLSTEKCPIKKW